MAIDTLDEINTKFLSALPLRDKDNLKIAPLPSDMKLKPIQQTETEKDFINLVKDNYQLSKEAKSERVRDMMTGIAFYADKHWTRYDAKSGRMEPIHEGEEQNEWVTVPLIGGFVDKRRARVCAQYPDVWSAPLTADERDKAAAQTARSILAHCYRQNDRLKQIRDWVTYSLISSTSFIKVWWDPLLEVDVALPQDTNPDGSIQYKYVKAPIGDVRELVMLATDLFIDPNADVLKYAEFVIHRCVKPMTDIQRDYKTKERGLHVNPDCHDGNYNTPAAQIRQIANGSGDSDKPMNAATVYEMWVKPCPRYPEGLVVTVADDKLLRCTEWPYKFFKDDYPFVELPYKPVAGSPWAMNMVTPLVDCQIIYNRVRTQMAKRADWDKMTIFMHEQSEVDPDFYDMPKDYQKYNYKGMPPQYSQPPSPGPFYESFLQGVYRDMCNITGIHDLVGDDGAPPQLSGIALELYELNDRNRDRTFIGSIESGLVKLCTIELALYRQFGTSQERLMGLDDQAIPSGQAKAGNFKAANVVKMQSLMDGECRVICTPGSGEAKSPAAKEEQLQKWVQLGAFGQPGTLSCAIAVATLSQTIRSDENVDNIIDVMKQELAQQQANQPNPMAVQQAADATKLQLAGEMAALKEKTDATVQQSRTEADIAVEDKRAAYAMQLEMLRHQNKVAEIQLQQSKQTAPKITLTGVLGPDGTVGAEHQAGLPETDDADDLQEAQDAELKAKAAKPAAGGHDGS